MPKDSTQDPEGVKNFIIRSSILLSGKKPSLEEIDSILFDFTKNGFDSLIRNHYVDELCSSGDFFFNLFRRNMVRFLETTTEVDIELKIRDFQFLLSDSSLSIFHSDIRNDQQRTQLLEARSRDFQPINFSISEFYRPFIDNWFYDQINMGTQNYVTSTFVHFLQRFPTQYELSESKNMVSGSPACLFNTAGKSKSDFISILLGSYECFESEVVSLYRAFIFREPKIQELVDGIDILSKPSGYIHLVKYLATFEEFIFFSDTPVNETKEEDKQITKSVSGFIVPTLSIRNTKILKSRFKTPDAFISIAWSDLTGTQISQTELERMIIAYNAIADKNIFSGLLAQSLLFEASTEKASPSQIWNFPVSAVLDKFDIPESPGQILLLLLLVEIQKADENVEIGQLKFIQKMSEKIPTAFFLTEIESVDTFISKSNEWRVKHPEEFSVLLEMRNQLFEEWARLDQNGYPALVSVIFRAEVKRIESTSDIHLDPILLVPRNKFVEKPDQFIDRAFLSLFNRHPDSFELWFLKEKVLQSNAFTIVELYLALFLSEEYKRY